jgi:mono/diheme cytochrome c family protein
MRGPMLPLYVFLAGVVFLTTGLLRSGEGGLAQQAAPDPETPTTPAEVYRFVCGQCHPPYSPRSRRKQDWPGVVEQMLQRADHREVALTDEQIERVVTYLQEHGR